MKDPHHICLRPQHHWTDQKVEVHVLCCVLALTLCSLLRREAHRHGIDRSIDELLNDLDGVREVGVIFPPAIGHDTPTLKMTLSSMSNSQHELYEALDLARYLTT